MSEEYEVTVRVTVSVEAESKDEARILAEEWTGTAQGAEDHGVSFVCAEAD